MSSCARLVPARVWTLLPGWVEDQQLVCAFAANVNANWSGLLLQEVEALLSENEMLQVKLHSQEEDFRLQNSTLMSELSKAGSSSL